MNKLQSAYLMEMDKKIRRRAAIEPQVKIAEYCAAMDFPSPPYLDSYIVDLQLRRAIYRHNDNPDLMMEVIEQLRKDDPENPIGKIVSFYDFNKAEILIATRNYTRLERSQPAYAVIGDFVKTKLNEKYAITFDGSKPIFPL